MECLKKFGQCCCLSQGACNCSCFVDCWWSVESQALAGMYCCSCCWTVCSPICIECKMGDCGKGWEDCLKGLKLCLFSCLASCVAPCDGLYTCYKTIMGAFAEGGIKEFKTSVRPTFTLLSEKIREKMELQMGPEPLKSFDTFTP